MVLLQTPMNRANQRVAAEVFADDFMRYKLSLVSERSKLAKKTKNRSEYILEHVIWWNSSRETFYNQKFCSEESNLVKSFDTAIKINIICCFVGA